MVMKISLSGRFFLVVPLTLEFKDVFFFFGKPSLGTPMVMKISLKRQQINQIWEMFGDNVKGSMRNVITL